MIALCYNHFFMTHTYSISGMTCSGCENKVKALLAAIPGVQLVSINRDKSEADITMQQHIPTQTLIAALHQYPRYQLSEKRVAMPLETTGASWFTTYKPILLIFAYITGVTLLTAITFRTLDLMHWMRYFMAAFFLVFSFFKLLDIRAFADSYVSYDIVAKKWYGWGIVYPFVELALGIAYLVNFNPLVTGIVTFIVMGISIIGVLQSVRSKQKIRCACLGAVFNLPMSTITIIEDGLMILMSGIMLVKLFA